MKMRTTVLASLSALVLVASACSTADGANWAGTLRDSAGVHIVENPATGIWTAEEGWQFTEDLRIGTAEGDPDYQFGLISAQSSIVIMSDGRIVVFDAQGQHMKVFATDGSFERTIGRSGSGPGEIGPADQSSILGLPGDTIQVNDFGNQRISFFLSDGTYLRSYGLDFSQGMAFRWEVTSDGRPVAQMRRIAFPGQPALTDSTDAILVRRTDGSPGDTLMRVPSGRTFQFTGGAPEWNFFVPEPVWALVGDRIYYGVNDNYRFGVYGPGGALERVISKPSTPMPITDADLGPMRASFARLLAEQGLPDNVVAILLRDRLNFHTHYPAFAQIVEGPNGTILTQLFQPVASMSDEERSSFSFQSGSLGSRRWDVFDAEGRFLGAVEMPLRFQPIVVDGNTIYGVQRDDLDVQYVVRLRIDTEET